MNLQSIDGHKVSIFDFSGTGLESGDDADHANNEVATGTLDTSNMTGSNPVRVLGFVRPSGQAPHDFDAQTVVDLSSVRARLDISWHREGSPAVFEIISSEGLVLGLDAEEISLFHHLMRAGVWSDLLDFV